MRALRARGLVPPWVRHYNLALIDYLYDTAVALLGAVEGPKVVAGWRRTKLMHAPLLRLITRHGYGMRATGPVAGRCSRGPRAGGADEAGTAGMMTHTEQFSSWAKCIVNLRNYHGRVDLRFDRLDDEKRD